MRSVQLITECCMPLASGDDHSIGDATTHISASSPPGALASTALTRRVRCRTGLLHHGAALARSGLPDLSGNRTVDYQHAAKKG